MISSENSKDAVLADIANLIGAPVRVTLRGGTIPRSFVDDVSDFLRLSDGGDKIAVLERCMAHMGVNWQSSWDSRDSPSGGGGTITTEGLFALFNTLVDFVEASDANATEELGPIWETYRRAVESFVPEIDSVISEYDPDLIGQGFARHNQTQNLLAHKLELLGAEPFSPNPSQPSFDIAWITPNLKVVAEVKSLTIENAESQLRRGLGQVLRYRSQLHVGEGIFHPVLVVDQPIFDETWKSTLDLAQVSILAAPDFKGIEDLI